MAVKKKLTKEERKAKRDAEKKIIKNWKSLKAALIAGREEVRLEKEAFNVREQNLQAHTERLRTQDNALTQRKETLDALQAAVTADRAKIQEEQDKLRVDKEQLKIQDENLKTREEAIQVTLQDIEEQRQALEKKVAESANLEKTLSERAAQLDKKEKDLNIKESELEKQTQALADKVAEFKRKELEFAQKEDARVQEASVLQARIAKRSAGTDLNPEAVEGVPVDVRAQEAEIEDYGLIVSTDKTYVIANSYLSLEEANLKLAGELGWENIANYNKTDLLIENSMYIDSMYTYRSSKTDSDQILEFPRGGDTTIPQQIKMASILLLKQILNNPESLKNRIQEEKVKDLSIKYASRGGGMLGDDNIFIDSNIAIILSRFRAVQTELVV